MTEKKINTQEEKVESQKLKKQGKIELRDDQLDAVGGGGRTMSTNTDKTQCSVAANKWIQK